MDMEKTMDLSWKNILLNNAVVFANIQRSTLFKKNQRKYLVNSKQKVPHAYGITPSFVSHCYDLQTFIVELSDIP